MGGVFKCMVPSCGRFYHRHCVELNSNSVIKQDLDEVRRSRGRGPWAGPWIGEAWAMRGGCSVPELPACPS